MPHQSASIQQFFLVDAGSRTSTTFRVYNWAGTYEESIAGTLVGTISESDVQERAAALLGLTEADAAIKRKLRVVSQARSFGSPVLIRARSVGVPEILPIRPRW